MVCLLAVAQDAPDTSLLRTHPMHNVTQTDVAVFGTLAALLAGGPLSEVFGQLGLMMALMGALGGATRAIAIKVPWSEVIRPTLLGALLAFGLGVIAPPVIERVAGIVPAPDTPAIPMLAASSFLIGFMQIRVISLLEKGKPRE